MFEINLLPSDKKHYGRIQKETLLVCLASLIIVSLVLFFIDRYFRSQINESCEIYQNVRSHMQEASKEDFPTNEFEFLEHPWLKQSHMIAALNKLFHLQGLTVSIFNITYIQGKIVVNGSASKLDEIRFFMKYLLMNSIGHEVKLIFIKKHKLLYDFQLSVADL